LEKSKPTAWLNKNQQHAGIIDTNVIVAGLRSRNGRSFELLQLIGKGIDQFGVTAITPDEFLKELGAWNQKSMIGQSE
jgi:predicted nucleic acid-binding protein